MARREDGYGRCGRRGGRLARDRATSTGMDLPLPLLLFNRRPHPLLLHRDLAPSLFLSSTNGPPQSPKPCGREEVRKGGRGCATERRCAKEGVTRTVERKAMPVFISSPHAVASLSSARATSGCIIYAVHLTRIPRPSSPSTSSDGAGWQPRLPLFRSFPRWASVVLQMAQRPDPSGGVDLSGVKVELICSCLYRNHK